MSYTPKGSGPFLNAQLYGCPMMDDTPWLQSESGHIFESPDGIRTEASWLPCTSLTDPLILPGTCDACASLPESDPQLEL